MTRTWTSILLLAFSISLLAQEPVLFGERGHEYRSDGQTTRIFLDRRGDFYPDVFIPDSLLRLSDNLLRSYYASQEDAMTVAQQTYGFEPSSNFYASYLRFQDSVEVQTVRQLNEKLTQETELFIMVHGFRKPLDSVSTGTNSFQDFTLVKEAILENRPDQPIHFIEVYWDGTYIPIEESISGILDLGRLFTRQAIPNATLVGLGLRKFISKINHPKIHFLAHSLGAQVVNNLLWNADAISGGATPSQKVEVCLIAPAVARKPFRSFYDRNTDFDYRVKDNYSYAIMYNERDIVVAKSNPGEKRYVRFTRFFGNTKLGCNCSREAEKVVRRFRNQYPNSTIKLLDATSVGNDHRWASYVKSEAFRQYLSEL